MSLVLRLKSFSRFKFGEIVVHFSFFVIIMDCALRYACDHVLRAITYNFNYPIR
jgi:uncharacterized protein YybS (DUF2232 family)